MALELRLCTRGEAERVMTKRRDAKADPPWADGYPLDGDVRALHCLHQREIRFGALRYLMFRDGDDRIWLLEYGLDMLPLTQMRFDVIYQNERYLIQRSPPPGRLDGEKKRRITHEGIDPRQYMGADPLLRQALRNFVVREKSGG